MVGGGDAGGKATGVGNLGVSRLLPWQPLLVITQVTACKRDSLRTPQGTSNETQTQSERIYLWKHFKVYNGFYNRTYGVNKMIKEVKEVVHWSEIRSGLRSSQS